MLTIYTSLPPKNQPIRLPGLKPGVCSGLILSGAFYPNLKIGFGAVERINSSASSGAKAGV